MKTRSFRVRLLVCVVIGMFGSLTGTGNALPDHAHPRQGVAAESAGARFVPLEPIRVLDSRDATSVTGGAPLGPSGVAKVSLARYVPTSAVAAVLNVTGAEATENTYLVAYPDGAERPSVSTLNLSRGHTRANGATVAIGVDSALKVYNNTGKVHVIVDLAGYYTSDSVGSGLTRLSTGRVLDTRSGAPVGPGGVITVDFSAMVPETATAVTFNLAGVSATKQTHVIAWPNGRSRPNVSHLYLLNGEATPNQVTVALGRDRKVALYNHSGSVHLIVDPTGFYASDRGLSFYPVTPRRILDTRPGRGIGEAETHSVSLAGILPASAASMVCNVAGTNTTTSTYVMIWPTGSPKPKAASHLNLVAGQTAANMAVAGLGAEQSIQIYNNAGYVDIIVDLSGYFADPGVASKTL
ncbi:hypothetical protein SAMN05192558_109369 [Actinokineospora alba]|uniref:Lactonase, 7-bladed beta-propeller n=1 Tax=Actinokineospora alba TaxID=504798 RepID=A0A1H0TAY3_9PSEU|nr:hypothetical protein [Actinokineospora alba]TDP66271.1 hypothetical protein C8E96_1771 [Actinokineospora alba]SDJ20610.1 hypothetical protein SAMN05421871_1116 [Actinokineospora alba]SDP51164.1 hypothetical protein SAMN05192558_109369 [Actinokineospora alba]